MAILILEANHGIWTIQQLLSHRGIKRTSIYTYPVNTKATYERERLLDFYDERGGLAIY